MITDKLSTFALATALNTGAAGTYAVGNVIDTLDLGGDGATLGNAFDLGSGRGIWLIVQVSTAATSGGSATGVIRLITHAAAAPTPGSEDIIVSSAVTAVAAMTAGKSLLKIMLPLEGVVYKRYISIEQVTATAAFTAGKIDALLTPDPSNWRSYPEGTN